MTMNPYSFFLLFLIILLTVSSQPSPNSAPTTQATVRRQNNIDFWPTSHLQTFLTSPQPHDACILFYAPWSQDAQSFAPLFERIGEIVQAGTKKSNLLMVYFDCEQDHQSQQICTDIGVKAYPEIMYLGRTRYFSDDFISGISGRRVGHPRLSVFNGDWRRGEEVRDFIYLMKGLGSWGVWEEKVRGWFRCGGRGKGGGEAEIGLEEILAGPTTAAEVQADKSTNSAGATDAQVQRLVKDNAELETLTNQAAVLMESVLMSDDEGDVFEKLLEGGGWDDDAILRNCVIDLSLDYCTRVVNKMDRLAPDSEKAKEGYEEKLMEELSDLEPYCSVFDECVRQDFPVDSICRPRTCPFNKEMGCKYVSACGGELLREEYTRMMEEIAGGGEVAA
ncbi:hypothetical protein TrVE_jg1054 [Triparma verrucosa]|uniref:Thioredoxin domain-containing protein n=1 Tax=Triparma verrucosa TaxID=1606542 RepID=A0A9W7BAY2_9STRA|nr:hypothetical protein TrVE_jg1054 [Triparma verrucosa]